MNDTTQKIAAEAAERIADLCESHPSLTREIKREIQSAIKKATEEKQSILDKYTTAMDAIYNHNEAARTAVVQYFGTLHSQGALRESRAAHASEPLPPPYRTSVLIKPAHANEVCICDTTGEICRPSYDCPVHGIGNKPAHASGKSYSDHCPRCGGSRQTLPCPVCEP